MAQRASIRQDLVDANLASPVIDTQNWAAGNLPADLLRQEFVAEQLDSLDNSEYNTLITAVDGRRFFINSIELDFLGEVDEDFVPARLVQDLFKGTWSVVNDDTGETMGRDFATRGDAQRHALDHDCAIVEEE